MRNAGQIANTWIGKAQSEADDFDRFVSLWFALNALYNEYFEGDERRAIGDMIFQGGYRLTPEAMSRALNTPAARYFVTRKIRDCRGSGRDTAEDAVILANGGEYSLKRRLKALLMILYQVRCNLFHGNKMYASDTDQEVVHHAGEAMMAVLAALMPEAILSGGRR